MELTEYASTCFSPITEEIYDQVQQISHVVSKYMTRKHTGVHIDVIKAVTYDVFMHFFEVLHDNPQVVLEERSDDHEIEEWAENAYNDCVEE